MNFSEIATKDDKDEDKASLPETEVGEVEDFSQQQLSGRTRWILPSKVTKWILLSKRTWTQPTGNDVQWTKILLFLFAIFSCGKRIYIPYVLNLNLKSFIQKLPNLTLPYPGSGPV